MKEIIKKIDKQIEQGREFGYIVFDKESVLYGLDLVKQIIQAEQKEKTNFDVITESPEKLAGLIENGLCCECCIYDCRLIDNIAEDKCHKGILAFLNRKAEEE